MRALSCSELAMMCFYADKLVRYIFRIFAHYVVKMTAKILSYCLKKVWGRTFRLAPPTAILENRSSQPGPIIGQCLSNQVAITEVEALTQRVPGKYSSPFFAPLHTEIRRKKRASEDARKLLLCVTTAGSVEWIPDPR
jgi:hypothetical protein